MFRLRRIVFSVAVLAACCAAPAQTTPRAGSLLKTSLTEQDDPAKAKLSAVSFFAVPPPEPRTIKPHDLVQIIIREQSEFVSEGNTDLRKQSNLDAKLEEYVKLSLRDFAIRNATADDPPALEFGLDRRFRGEAAVDRTDSFTARITAEVVDVKPNGTLVLQARKRIKTDEEEQQLTLTGVCRAIDINVDNTVLSTQLYDLELHKEHKGAVRDTTKRGWIPRLLDLLNPF